MDLVWVIITLFFSISLIFAIAMVSSERFGAWADSHVDLKAGTVTIPGRAMLAMTVIPQAMYEMWDGGLKTGYARQGFMAIFTGRL